MLLTHTHQIENGEIEILEQNEYDDLGKLVTKHLGGSQSYVDDNGKNLQKVDYTYNIRGWLTEINNINDLDADEDLFAFKINYNQPEVYGNQGLYNGNISETLWKSATENILRGYGYAYDGLNRLRNAFYGENGQLNHAFNENLTYDKNGNILTLHRNSSVDFFTQAIDELTYEYDGNQLQKVTDAPNANRHFGFVDGTNTNNDYEYDLFGNMTADRNKGIIQIRYNHLNLPIQIQFANGGSISYNYHANGVKFRKFVQNGSAVTETRYIGGFQYMNQKLQFMHLPQGYINVLEGHKPPQERVYDYVYQYKDHLGNIRQSFAFDRDRQEIRTLTEHNYYPFGLEHSYLQTRRRPELFDGPILDGIIAEPGGQESRYTRMVQVDDVRYQYKYNGKEYQDELGLNFYDYGARNYDPALGRWMNIDPLAEKYYSQSSFNYVANNPILFVDPNGKEISFSVTRDENGDISGINIHITGKIINNSSSNLSNKQLEKKRNDIIKGLSNIKVEGDINVSFTGNIEIANSESDIQENDHVFRIVDDISKIQDNGHNNPNTKPVGLARLNQNIIYLLPDFSSRTAAHEIGHSAGLKHISDSNLKDFNLFAYDHFRNIARNPQLDTPEQESAEKYVWKMLSTRYTNNDFPKNLMHQSSTVNSNGNYVSGNKLTFSQISTIMYNIENGRINQGAQK